jgi:hypothetical protein
VIIAPGTYTGGGNRDLDFLGKAITVRSTDPNDPNIVAATVIDCDGTRTEHHRGFYFHSEEDANSVVAGLMITRGYTDEGGGIYFYGGSPAIINCVLRNNSALGRGAALACRNSEPSFDRCELTENESGVFCGYSRLIFNSCTFTGNTGYAVRNSDSILTFTDCKFEGNGITTGHSGAIRNHSDIQTETPYEVSLTGCTFIGNSTWDYGGAINNYSGGRAKVTVTNCIFIGNSSNFRGGAIYNHNTSPIITGCLFLANRAGDTGGAISNETGSKPAIINCTITSNHADNGGGAISSVRSCNPIISNSIVWGNTADKGDNIYLVVSEYGDPTAITVSYSDIGGGYDGVYVEPTCTLSWGEGNINAEPCFVNLLADDYHLSAFSPCINVGDPAYIPSFKESDIDGEPRVMGGRVDIGADEFTTDLAPILRISPTELRFSSYANDPSPEVQTLSIQNTGSGTLDWEIVGDCSWLHIYPANGISICGQVNKVTVTVDIAGLDPGQYNCKLTITAKGAVNSPQVVTVMLDLGGSDLYVPLEYGTIQAAIDVAIDWDTVIVIDGIYTGPGNSDIDFKGKSITVRSENGPENCIIDCNGTEKEPHRGFYFHSGERANSILDGLTIVNGYHWEGGAILCYNSSPIIANCFIKRNSSIYGGGITCFYSSPQITNCIITGNKATKGAGVCNTVRPPVYPSTLNTEITTNHIMDNMIIDTFNFTYNWEPSIINCTIYSNIASGEGGGLYCPLSSFRIANTIIWTNLPQQIICTDGAILVIYSNIQDGWAGEGNINTDPFFVSAGHWADANDPNITLEPNDPNAIWIDGNYHLKSQAGRWDPNSESWVKDDVSSPCIDAGDPNTCIGFEPNPNGRIVNMGAYGGTSEASLSPSGISCISADHPDYDEWVKVSKPICWCYRRQCHGDADGKSQGKKKYWVSTEDLDILIAAWNKPFEQLAGNQICADFDHLPQGKSKYRVSTDDLDILISNWNIANKPNPDCP